METGCPTLPTLCLLVAPRVASSGVSNLASAGAGHMLQTSEVGWGWVAGDLESVVLPKGGSLWPQPSPATREVTPMRSRGPAEFFVFSRSQKSCLIFKIP